MTHIITKNEKLKEALLAGIQKDPRQEKKEQDKLKKEILKRAEKEFIKRKKKFYANEHPKYRSNIKQD
tara:strand:- start:378 stop:581 length:204 start_codon:yes stop_codon:yes gene_type:complete